MARIPSQPLETYATRVERVLTNSEYVLPAKAVAFSGNHYTDEYSIPVQLDAQGALVGTYYAVVFGKETVSDAQFNRDRQQKYAHQHGISQLTYAHIDLDLSVPSPKGGGVGQCIAKRGGHS